MSMPFIYFIAINVIMYVMMANDKKKAQKRKYRTRERTLWIFALLGGAPGGFVAMQTYRHKTKHTSFKYGMPALAVIDLLVLAMIGGTAI